MSEDMLKEMEKDKKLRDSILKENQKWYHVLVQTPNQMLHDKLFFLIGSLRPKIQFDYEWGPKSFNLDLDWSLEGATVDEVLKILDDNGFSYTKEESLPTQKEKLALIDEWLEMY